MLQDKYKTIEENEIRVEEFMLDDAEYVVMGYGIISRILKTAVEKLRADGIKVGLLRPITLFPFPNDKIKMLSEKVRKMLVVEMSNGQMVQDVKLASLCRCPIEFYGRMGGVVPSMQELLDQTKKFVSSEN